MLRHQDLNDAPSTQSLEDDMTAAALSSRKPASASRSAESDTSRRRKKFLSMFQEVKAAANATPIKREDPDSDSDEDEDEDGDGDGGESEEDDAVQGDASDENGAKEDEAIMGGDEESPAPSEKKEAGKKGKKVSKGDPHRVLRVQRAMDDDEEIASGDEYIEDIEVGDPAMVPQSSDSEPEYDVEATAKVGDADLEGEAKPKKSSAAVIKTEDEVDVGQDEGREVVETNNDVDIGNDVEIVPDDERHTERGICLGRIFTRLTEVGVYSTDVPVCTYKRGTQAFCVTACDHIFRVYDLSRLTGLIVGGLHPKKIRAVAASSTAIYTAAGNKIYMWHGPYLKRTFTGNTGRISHLLLFGKTHLLSLERGAGKALRIWDTSRAKECEGFPLPRDFSATCILHPDAYLNKVLLGSEQGKLLLVNIHTKSIIYEFKGWSAEVTCLAQSPVIDVVAIGLASGKIYVHNLLMDQTVCSFTQSGSPISSLSFRTDLHPLLVSGGEDGSLAMWNLMDRSLQAFKKGAHAGKISSLYFLYGEPILLSVGSDNAMNMWIFDNPGNIGEVRLLRYRSGHPKPIQRVRQYTNQLMTCSADGSVRLFDPTAGFNSSELSQSSYAASNEGAPVRLPRIVALDAWPLKDNLWDSLVTAHSNKEYAATWSVRSRRLNGQLVAEGQAPRNVTAVAISYCGNFAFVGTAAGWVGKFNIQSGLLRQTFEYHTRGITGIVCDNLSKHVITTSLDRTLRVWDFASGDIESELEFRSAPSQIVLNRDNNLLAISLDDGSVKVFDIDTQNVVRHFTGHSSQINDMAFLPSGHWLLTAGMDRTVRVWDIPSGKLLDWMRLKRPVTSLVFNNIGNFLCTTCTGQRSIQIWVNNNWYTPLLLGPPPPITTSFSVKKSKTPKSSVVEIPAEDDLCTQLDLVTLSSVPESHWKPLKNLELIKERNKPIEPPKKPSAAPFFLVQPEKSELMIGESHILGQNRGPRPSVSIKTKLEDLLSQGYGTHDYVPVMKYLKQLGPSAIDMQIRALTPENDHESLKHMLAFLHHWLKLNRDFELIQAFTDVFFRAHGDAIIQIGQKEKGTVLQQTLSLSSILEDRTNTTSSKTNVVGLVDTILETQTHSWNHLEHLFNTTLALINFAGGMKQ
ncbi:U3 small nucleolar RNA-associated protein 21 [Pelomyxa schiedti]|nr:U3 small nucleolar RNA-associated protein 21 [Pelomyxa schiedti]